MTSLATVAARKLGSPVASKWSKKDSMAAARTSSLDWLIELLERPDDARLRVLIAGPESIDPVFDFHNADLAEVTTWGEPDFPFDAPWTAPAPQSFDVIVIAGLLDRPGDPKPFLRYLRHLAPLVVIEHPLAGDPQLRAQLTDGEFRLQEVPEALAAGRPVIIGHRDFDFGRRREPILVHVHIPKCAGTTVSKMLELAFGALHHNFYPQGPDFTPSADQLGRVVANVPATKSLASHSIRIFPPQIAGRTALYICFLRDPLEQFVSYTTYIKKNFAGLRPAHKILLPPDCDLLSLKEIAERIMTRPHPVPFDANFNTWFLTAAAFAAGLPSPLSEAARQRAEALYHEIDLQMALDTLSKFLLVGMSDRMDESIELLRYRVKPYGLDLDGLNAGHENLSRDFIDDISWLNPEDDVGKRVLKSIEKDRHLFETMRRRFDRDLDAAGIAGRGGANRPATLGA